MDTLIYGAEFGIGLVLGIAALVVTSLAARRIWRATRGARWAWLVIAGAVSVFVYGTILIHAQRR